MEGRAEGGVLFSLHLQTAMKGTPYVHASRLYAKSPCDSRREVRGASSELSAEGSAEKQNARPCTTWASIAQAPPGPKPGPRHSKGTLVLKKSGLHVCIHSRAHHCATYAPTFLAFLPLRRRPAPGKDTAHSRCSVGSNSLPLPLARAGCAAAPRAPPAGSRGNDLSRSRGEEKQESCF